MKEEFKKEFEKEFEKEFGEVFDYDGFGITVFITDWIEQKIKEARIDENQRWCGIFVDDRDVWYKKLAYDRIEELEGVEK